MATTATTRVDQETAFPPTLFVAFDGSEQMEPWLHYGSSAAAIPLDGGWLGRGAQRRPGTRIYRSSQYATAQQRPDTSAVGSATSIRPPR